jgi:hypothetical protein
MYALFANGGQIGEGRLYTDEGAPFVNVDLGPEFERILTEGFTQGNIDVIDLISTSVAGFGAKVGMDQEIDTQGIKDFLEGVLDSQGADAMLEAAEKIKALVTDPDFTSSFEGKSEEEQANLLSGKLSEVLGPLADKLDIFTGQNLPDATDSTTADLLGIDEAQFNTAADSLGSSISTAISQAPSWINDLNMRDREVRLRESDKTIRINLSGIPAAPGKDGGDGKGGDTTTSRLASTLMRHGMYDNMLAGKRTVTSSLRSNNLGSLNSDHLTGNAYDLTGQNLVGYAAMVNRSGGFAEFHGMGADRHLHVVPGMPMGDAVSPAPMPVVAASGGSSTTYSIQINANGGQDPNAIANAVMAKIDQRDRNVRERS